MILTLPLAACGDDGNTTTEATTQASSTGNGSTGGGSTGSATTESPTTGDVTTGDDPSTTVPGTSTDASTGGGGSTGGGSTGGGSTSSDTTTGGGSVLSWEKDVYPVIVEGTCSCHAAGSGGLKMTSAMDSYMNLVGVDSTQAPGFKRVAAGDPANSYFLAKVAGTAGMAPFNSGSPAQMPKGGAPKGQMAIDILTQWIADGANP